ncbi:14139_t:CDS:2 [Funneliformis caledonium]|uniref:14139_t:CDS:1 n=1 Tax=Funneliformis caledonium TaxID=1117310 RepID=A0A9N9F208_9GLOM|nr:14139_t:CDS:2 [Funneliformis caledonium]
MSHDDVLLMTERLERWKQRLQNLTEIQLPTDYPRPLPPKVVEATKILHLPEITALAVLQLSLGISPTNGSNPSPFSILLAAFTILLYRYTGDEDITVGSSSDSRNPLVLRIRIGHTDTFEQVLQKVQQVEQEATSDEVPFHLLLSKLFPPKDKRSNAVSKSTNGVGQESPSIPSHSPLFRVRFFNQTDIPENPLLQVTSSTTDLTVSITSHSSSSLRQALLPSIEIRISYNQILFSEKRISHVLDQLITVINNVHKNKELRVAEIPILTKKCLDILPDPRADLDWSGFHGAITDIFSDNAKKFPDKSCVVESRDGSNKRRVFTYRHINEASNLVAHHLIQNGIEREDVVMVYAYRAKEVETMLSGEYNLASEMTDLLENNVVANKNKTKGSKENKAEFDYASDYESLLTEHIQESYEPIIENYPRKNFFVTGVTGFLGAFIVSSLLDFSNDIKLIVHVRAKTKALAMERIKKSCMSHLVWRGEWETRGRLEVVCGDLEEDRLGISEEEWKSLAERSGYGQSKWVSEKLIMEANKRGMPATIIRPGYIVGHSTTGVTNTDDFIWRLIKGCIQLGVVPTIYNTINMCPVNYVAECVTRVSLSPIAASKCVFHITHPSSPSFRLDELFSCLPRYGYTVDIAEYIVWRNKLMEFTLQAGDNALYPLLHFVLDDLPTSTKSPELDNTNTREIVGKECERMGERLIGIYLGYLVKVGFLDKPDIRENHQGYNRILELPDVFVALEGVEVLRRSNRS